MSESVFYEMEREGELREEYRAVRAWIDESGPDALRARRAEAEMLFRKIGITFLVYGDTDDPERLIPFDLVPRIFSAAEWSRIEQGVTQRAKALNAFLADIYGEREILKAGRVPAELVLTNSALEPSMSGVKPALGVFSHIVGTDIVRTGPDAFLVLEDNCRTPSGVSYMLENRAIMTRMFPELFANGAVRPVDTYPDLLRNLLESVGPERCEGPPTIAILTPGSMNSAYYEHSFLADQMGVELVEGPDLYVDEDHVFMRTTRGPQRVDVIYRRIDDAFLDPRHFRPDSLLGAPGLMDAYRSGGVTIVNAPGAGIADDKAIYSYVPEMIGFYLGERPLLDNVQTFRCGEADDLAYVLDRLGELVVKEVHGSGGYGLLIGPKSTAAEREAYKERILADPAGFIAQPTLALSTCPTLVEEGLAPRHVDFRPFALVGKEVSLAPGGLTRVALAEGSLVVNSSQGGGVKDTWVLAS
ncbi:MAG: circularly permuted type 2 ATP-grasp protein [Caulobacterales bacterium]|nr:circularly permuted type 2 ATP-grasp protein [Caulobacterales bacterium]